MTAAPPLAKYLASTDKQTRDKAIGSVSAFFSKQDQDELPRADLLKLWKGIFYCFWMSDKPLVQQALASEIAEIVLTIPDVNSSLAFLDGFWETIVREWNGIDRLRMDKYYMLVRRFLNASFRLLIRNSWDVSLCNKYNSLLVRQGGPLCPSDMKVPASLAFHIAELYLEELDRALAKEEGSDAAIPLVVILDPFFRLAARHGSNSAINQVQGALFLPLMASFPSPTEVRPAKRMRTEGESQIPGYPDIIASSSFDDPTSREPDTTTLKRKLLRRMFEIASEPETPDSNRRKLYAFCRNNLDDEDEEEEEDDE